MFDKIYKITILTIALIIGILTTKFFPYSLLTISIILTSSLLFCLLIKNQTLATLSLLINFIFLGQLSISFEKRKNFDDVKNITCVAYLAQIVDEEKNVAKVVSYKNGTWQTMQPQSYVKFKTNEKFQYGDLILVQGILRRLKNDVNPFCFDYKKFLQEQNITYYHNLIFYKKIGNVPENYFKAKLKFIREKLKNILQKHIHDEQARGVILAMMLGLKGDF